MELTEVVSPSVAVPVLCVLVCAFLVFAFGFKSPAQPPSFDVFDEDGKKKRTKKSKGSKSQSNGHAVPAADGDVNNSAKPQSSPRQPTKQSSKTQSPVAAKSRSAAQATQEAPKKTKKQTLKEKEEEAPSKKRQVPEDVDVDGWHTVPKKDKKQKKKESEPRLERMDIGEKRDSPVKEEEIPVVVKIEEAVAATCSASLDMATEMPGSPQEQRAKRKKEKKNKKAKLDEETVENVEQITTEMEIVEATLEVVAEPELERVPEPEPVELVPEPEPVELVLEPEPVELVLEPEPVELVPEPEVINTNVIELEIKDAMETTMNDETSKNKKYKKDKKKAFAEEDDFVIPQAALKPELVEREPERTKNLPLKENTDALTVKLPKKKQKKDRSKRNEEKLPNSIEIGASGGVDSSLSQSPVSDSQPKKIKLKDTSVKEDSSFIEAPPESSPGAEGGAVAADVSSPPQPTATFDELGGVTESWTEAKPKSKKKKARRAD